MGREREVRQTKKAVQIAAAKKILGCSSTTSNTVLRAELRAELGMYPLKTNRDAIKLKWQYKLKR